MIKAYSFKWSDCGFIVALSSSDGLTIEGDNIRVTFGLREIAVKGVYEGLREHLQDQRGTKKVVYLDLAFPIRGIKEPKGTVFRNPVDLSLGAYGLSYTPLEPAGSYLTVYPPPGSLYEYAVVSPDRIALFTIGRRQIYVMEENKEHKIVMV